MAEWAWELADRNGVTVAELTAAVGRSISYRRNGPAEAQFSIAHEDEVAGMLLDELRNGVPRLRCWRRADGDSEAVLRFNGYLAPFTEEAEEQSLLTAIFRSPFARLLGDGAERGRFTDADVTFTGTDAGQIAVQLIDTANLDGHTGLETAGGTIEATVTRDRTYQFANVGQAIENLTNVLDGFDFEEEFVDGDTVLALFHVHAQLGQDRPDARFEYGHGTLANVRRVQRTQNPPVNVARVLGANGLSGTRTLPDSVDRHGWWGLQVSASDVTEQATLEDKAHALLRANWTRTVEFIPDFSQPACPKPWEDFTLGDTVGFYARRDALTEDVQVRVNGLRVVVADDGTEAAEVQDPLALEDEATIRARISVEVTG